MIINNTIFLTKKNKIIILFSNSVRSIFTNEPDLNIIIKTITTIKSEKKTKKNPGPI